MLAKGIIKFPISDEEIKKISVGLSKPVLRQVVSSAPVFMHVFARQGWQQVIISEGIPIVSMVFGVS